MEPQTGAHVSDFAQREPDAECLQKAEQAVFESRCVPDGELRACSQGECGNEWNVVQLTVGAAACVARDVPDKGNGEAPQHDSKPLAADECVDAEEIERRQQGDPERVAIALDPFATQIGD